MNSVFLRIFSCIGLKTFGLTVAICGKVLQRIVAINFPPNVGRVAASLPLSFMSKSVQSAVSPVCNEAAILGAKSRPCVVAPIRIISGFISFIISIATLE